MRLKKCPMCKNPVPEGVQVCPLCETQYSKFQYFKMNYLSKCIILMLITIIAYNSVVVISCNRKIRNFLNNPPENITEVEGLREEYEKLNFIQKYFVHSTELENIENSLKYERKIEEVYDRTCLVYFANGSKEGTYTGQMYQDMPDGKGLFTYYLDDGTICTYDGDFKNGEITGFGVMNFSDGREHIGKFRQGLLDGFGVMYSTGGNIEKKGEFVAGVLNGNATIYDNYGMEIYSGRFIAGVPSESEYKSICQETTFAQLEADSDAYANKNILIKGVVTDIVIQDDMTVLYLINIEGDSFKNICIEYIGVNKRLNIREGDSLRFYGYFAGYRTFVSNRDQKNGGMIIKTYYVS